MTEFHGTNSRVTIIVPPPDHACLGKSRHAQRASSVPFTGVKAAYYYSDTPTEPAHFMITPLPAANSSLLKSSPTQTGGSANSVLPSGFSPYQTGSGGILLKPPLTRSKETHVCIAGCLDGRL